MPAPTTLDEARGAFELELRPDMTDGGRERVLHAYMRGAADALALLRAGAACGDLEADLRLYGATHIGARPAPASSFAAGSRDRLRRLVAR